VEVDAPLSRRRAGVLLHPTSLPGGLGLGDLGSDAYRFIEFLSASGITVWQMLPLVPTHGDLSPYQGLSVHAGNPLLISLDLLREWGWLTETPDIEEANFSVYRLASLKLAYKGFSEHADAAARAEFQQFSSSHKHWLEDYAYFQAIRQSQQGQHWLNWPKALRDRDMAALEQINEQLGYEIDEVRFEQFVFFRQWQKLRDYAQQHGVLLFGDIPIFVAHDSAEVWAHREYFTLDEHGQAQVVAGVPPDYFSETGQRWGNPHYRWDKMQADGFAWWKARLATQLDLFDWVRIDHFRGFESYWEIPAEEETAMNGHWVAAPGDKLFEELHAAFDPLPLVAEDLGIITPEVDALRRKHGLPGMKILQFAFDGNPANPYIPYNHSQDSVVYTGTHDNDTTLGWFESLSQKEQARIKDYLGESNEAMPKPFIRITLASVAKLAILPMQDLLALDGKHRMNTPGTTEGNWLWRFDWSQLAPELASEIKGLLVSYGRC
jgi:4-alpha-glucanotransferase